MMIKIQKRIQQSKLKKQSFLLFIKRIQDSLKNKQQQKQDQLNNNLLNEIIKQEYLQYRKTYDIVLIGSGLSTVFFHLQRLNSKDDFQPDIPSKYGTTETWDGSNQNHDPLKEEHNHKKIDLPERKRKKPKKNKKTKKEKQEVVDSSNNSKIVELIYEKDETQGVLVKSEFVIRNEENASTNKEISDNIVVLPNQIENLGESAKEREEENSNTYSSSLCSNDGEYSYNGSAYNGEYSFESSNYQVRSYVVYVFDSIIKKFNQKIRRSEEVVDLNSNKSDENLLNEKFQVGHKLPNTITSLVQCMECIGNDELYKFFWKNPFVFPDNAQYFFRKEKIQDLMDENYKPSDTDLLKIHFYDCKIGHDIVEFEEESKYNMMRFHLLNQKNTNIEKWVHYLSSTMYIFYVIPIHLYDNKELIREYLEKFRYLLNNNHSKTIYGYVLLFTRKDIFMQKVTKRKDFNSLYSKYNGASDDWNSAYNFILSQFLKLTKRKTVLVVDYFIDATSSYEFRKVFESISNTLFPSM